MYCACQLKKKKKAHIPKTQLCFFHTLGGVWYIYLKIENCCLKIYVEICVGKKVCKNTCKVV